MGSGRSKGDVRVVGGEDGGCGSHDGGEEGGDVEGGVGEEGVEGVEDYECALGMSVRVAGKRL